MNTQQRIAIFCGPTISKAEVLEIIPDALVLDPAEQADIDFVVTQLGARIIGMIDGVHRDKLPIAHREILSSLDKGVRILGSSSMGALRAVECEPWGAEPVGEIASWYSQGIIDSDDEVCVSHGDESMGWKQFSVPLVNIRATLISAQIGEDRAEEIIAAARSLFYPDRIWPRIFDLCEARDKERHHILDHEIDLKHIDALHLCYTIQKLPPRKEPERKPQNLRTGFGAVFGVTDRKTIHGDKILRLYELADGSPNANLWAADRQLALEFCKFAGIEPREKVSSVEGLPFDDLEGADRIRLCNEERTLARAREWVSSSGGTFWDASHCTDWLRANGLYTARKEALK